MAHKHTPIDFVKMYEEGLASKIALTDQDVETLNKDNKELERSQLNAQLLTLVPKEPVTDLAQIDIPKLVQNDLSDSEDDSGSISGISDDIEVIGIDEELTRMEPVKETGAKPKTAQSTRDDLKKKTSRKKVRGDKPPQKTDDHAASSVPVNAMIMKVEQNMKDQSKDGLRGDTRMGWIGPDQYTIADFWQSKDRVISECSADIVAQIREHWYNDRWNGLVSPSGWVGIELFYECIPGTATNQEAGSALLLADVNLKLAKARKEGNFEKVLELIKNSDYHLLAPLDTFGTAVRRSERAIVEATKVAQAAHKGALEALMVAETFTEKLRTQVKAVTEDTINSTEHKTDQILTMMKTIANKQDVTSGELKAETQGHSLAGVASGNRKSQNLQDLLRTPDPSRTEEQNTTDKTEKKGSVKPKNWFPAIVR